MVIRATYDAPWKEVMETYLQQFLELSCPTLAGHIDWSKGYEPLDKELNAITADSETGARTVDKLIKVWCADGEETWVLLHVELQAQPDNQFAERMWVYYYRLFDRYRKPVVSLAVLADDQLNWRPQGYTQSLWGCRLQFEFLMLKLLDFEPNAKAMAESLNPFAVVILAHLAALKTRQDAQARFNNKLQLTRSLYSKGLDKTGILNLYAFIDAVLALPPPLELKYLDEIEQFEQEHNMPYITSAERIGLEKGLEQGLEQGRLEGENLGLEKAKKAIAKKLLAQGLSVEVVSQITELAVADVEILANDSASH